MQSPAAALAGRAPIPLWVMVVGAAGIAIGLMLYGPRLIRKVGREITATDDFAAAGAIVQQAYFGLPGYPRDDEYDRRHGEGGGRAARAAMPSKAGAEPSLAFKKKTKVLDPASRACGDKREEAPAPSRADRSRSSGKRSPGRRRSSASSCASTTSLRARSAWTAAT